MRKLYVLVGGAVALCTAAILVGRGPASIQDDDRRDPTTGIAQFTTQRHIAQPSKESDQASVTAAANRHNSSSAAKTQEVSAQTSNDTTAGVMGSDGESIKIVRLKNIYRESPHYLADRVEAYMARENIDPDWSHEAQNVIDHWFNLSGPAESAQTSKCYSTVCYVDIYMPFLPMKQNYSEIASKWGEDQPKEFLPYIFYVSEGPEFHRYFFFRDTFDPANLQEKLD